MHNFDMDRIIESSSLLMEFFGKKKEKKPKKTYKYSDVVGYMKGIRSIAKSVVKGYNFDDVYIQIDDDVFGNYEKGQDFESFDDFPIIRFDSDSDSDVKKFLKEFGDKVREKYPVDVDVEYDKSEVNVYVVLD
jgi:hypothetical protein